jgi:ribosomal protein L3 glutamine methyltransferase
MSKLFVNPDNSLFEFMETAIDELSTVRDMIRWGVSQFYTKNIYYGHGTDNAWDEAVHLTLHAINLPWDINPEALNAKLTRHERKAVAQLITQRINKRKPSPYLTNQAWFAGILFYVDERVLIPRSPIAELIQNRFEPWLVTEPKRILDLCTGSGCIAIACAYAFPEAQVDAVDLSKDALEVAKINIENKKLGDQVKLINSNLYQRMPLKKYDLILSNPPYVSASEMTKLPSEYRHEPRMALEAADEGLIIIKRILQNASDFLTDDGILIVEVGSSEEALIKRYPDVPFTWLEFSQGGEGVFLLTAKQAKEYFG